MRQTSSNWWVLNNFCCVFCLPTIAISCQQPDRQTIDFSNIPSPASNPITEEGVALGKILFSDTRLSSDGKISCATCHNPDSFFVSSIKSTGPDSIGRQISPLYNMAWSTVYFWDGSEENLESLIIKPIINPDEMHGDLARVVSHLNSDKELKEKFKAVFQTDSIYTALVSRAISQYIRTLIKDRPVLGKSDANALEGGKIFDRLCSQCHSGKATSDFKLRKSPLNGTGPDSGRFRISKRLEDVYFFKTPGLANVSKTAPYTHNGKLPDLQAVVKGYASVMKDSVLNSVPGQQNLIRFLEKL